MVHIVNVHLEAHPYRGSDRVNQLKHALHRLELRQQGRGLDPEAAAVVVAGDFNSLPLDAPCTLLRRGRLDAFATEAHLPQVGRSGAGAGTLRPLAEPECQPRGAYQEPAPPRCASQPPAVGVGC